MVKNKTVGIKYDGSKIRTDLLSSVAIEEICKVLTYGVQKYGDDNWRYGMRWRRLIGSTFRHLYAFMRGEDNDPETGLSHVAHAGCGIMFLLEYVLTGNGTDDRWNEKNKMPNNADSGQNNTKTKRKVKRKK